MTSYGVLYGGEGRPDFEIDEGYATPETAAAAYDPARRIRYQDGLLGGAEVVRLGEAGCPVESIQVLADDEPAA